jgi:hypothetical protein
LLHLGLRAAVVVSPYEFKQGLTLKISAHYPLKRTKINNIHKHNHIFLSLKGEDIYMEKNTVSAEMLSQMNLPQGITIREFYESDFPEIQSLYEKEGWLTVIKRPEEAMKAWKNSNLVLVALYDNRVCGVIRGFTDTEITTYIIGTEIR